LYHEEQKQNKRSYCTILKQSNPEPLASSVDGKDEMRGSNSLEGHLHYSSNKREGQY
jgi:hypothetical protein